MAQSKPDITRRQMRSKPIDFQLLIALVVICAFGLVMVFSASYYYAQNRFDGDGFHYVKTQAICAGLGFAALITISFIDYHIYDKLKLVAVLIAVVLMILVVFVGEERNGAQRWLALGNTGFTLQPSELVKFVLVIYMAAFMAKRPHLMNSFSRGLVPMLLVIAMFSALMLLQKNLSMMIIILLTGVVMLFVGGARMKHLVLLALIAIPILAAAVLMEEYRRERVLMFVNPWESTIDGAYQLRQSLMALGSGGLFGKGLNFSRQKLLFLPYGESDFVFAIVGEELGFIGCILVIAAYAFIVYRGIHIAIHCRDRFGSLVAAGLTAILGMQAAVNIAVATSSVPPTGQTLPFISSGGTSLAIFLSAMGILLNISKNTE